MRVFIAIELPQAARDVVQRLQEPLARVRGLRLTRSEQCHLTLKFLGEVEPLRAPASIAALRGIRERAFELSFTSLGTFPNARRPRVVWVGVTTPPELDRLAHAVDRATADFLLDKPFQAHVTLARVVAQGVQLDSAVMEQKVAPCRFTVNAFTCFESLLGPAGSRYRVLENFALER